MRLCSQKRNAHPQLTWQQCTVANGCTTQAGAISLDSNWDWTHKLGDYQPNCYDGNKWDKTLCPDAETCAHNCALDAGSVPEFESTYGISAQSDALSLRFLTRQQRGGSNVGSRTYLYNQDKGIYQMFTLKNREFSFDVDVSQLPCGLNGALYFVQMDPDGGMKRFPGNKAGANFGTG